MNELDQTFRVDAQFSDTTIQPYIHSSVEANIIIRQKQLALIIPKEALNTGDSVLIIQHAKRKTIPVQPGIRTLDQVEILYGLDESAEVVIPIKK
jgi:multidrug efflux pump subunit AcrA (membrane-fusion protein)